MPTNTRVFGLENKKKGVKQEGGGVSNIFKVVYDSKDDFDVDDSDSKRFKNDKETL